jgi:phage I-like protein
MLDLEHLSLEDGIHFDPDARGWYDLEDRGGDLWAVNVRWTPDGARRLTERTQGYVSPAFNYDEKTGELLEIVNIGLVAMPATFRAFPLARLASRHAKENRAQMTTKTKALSLSLLAILSLASRGRSVKHAKKGKR